MLTSSELQSIMAGYLNSIQTTMSRGFVKFDSITRFVSYMDHCCLLGATAELSELVVTQLITSSLPVD